MKYYIVSGEASGDLHAANLVKEIKKKDATAVFRGWGGDKMDQEGVVIVKHYRELAFMGFLEVVKNLRTILKNISFCKSDIQNWKPDAVILVDYPGFNLRIASFVKQLGIKVIYYISPQVWAWKKSRVYKIKQWVDKMLVILPFEKAFYDKYNYPVSFVGHPLLDAIENSEIPTPNFKSKKPIIALLPGSRKQEISIMLPVMLEMCNRFANYQFVLAAAPSIPISYYESFTKNFPVQIISGNTYGILKHAHAALVTSGTATLETALFGIPEVVCYKGGTVSYLIARQLVDIKYISLVNLILDEEVVKELIQNDFNAEALEKELKLITQDGKRDQMLQSFVKLKNILGNSGASEKAAGEIFNYLNGSR